MKKQSTDLAHIPGWGIDIDPANEPTYPMKTYTGEDHERLHYRRPPLQHSDTEILRSVERPNRSAVFGTAVPPTGISGKLRRVAFQYSEGSFKHWMTLILADRVNMVEGLVDDISHGHLPNIFQKWDGGLFGNTIKSYLQKKQERYYFLLGQLRICCFEAKNND